MLNARFASLSRLLTDLGFVARTGPTFIRFDHAESGTWFLYPLYGDEEEVTPSDLVGTGYILDARGLLSREQFEERLRPVPMAS